MADVNIDELMEYDAIDDALISYRMNPTEQNKRAVIAQIAEDVLDAAESDAEIVDSDFIQGDES